MLLGEHQPHVPLGSYAIAINSNKSVLRYLKISAAKVILCIASLCVVIGYGIILSAKYQGITIEQRIEIHN